MVVILGMAGAGKSTLCKKLAPYGPYQWFALGEVLRARETGAALSEMVHGGVLDNGLVTPIVREELARLGDSPEVLLDGCPRTVEQAKWLALGDDTPAVRMVIHIVVDEQTAEVRLAARGRADDNLDAMRLRFAGYHRDIDSVLSEFGSAGIAVYEIDGAQEEQEVFEQAKGLLGQ
jgi:adenylate kinase family enzyme